jgi:hypothetical protein
MLLATKRHLRDFGSPNAESASEGVKKLVRLAHVSNVRALSNENKIRKRLNLSSCTSYR